MEKALKDKSMTKKQTRRKKTTNAPSGPQNIIALVYDFDGTLSPKNMQEYAFLPKIKTNPKSFWREVAALSIEREAEPLITYMHLMYQKAQEKGVQILRNDLVAQGKSIEYCPGVEKWFDLINAYVKQQSKGAVKVRHYLANLLKRKLVMGSFVKFPWSFIHLKKIPTLGVTGKMRSTQN